MKFYLLFLSLFLLSSSVQAQTTQEERFFQELRTWARDNNETQLRERIRVIWNASSSTEERILLATIDFHETTLGKNRGIPFGAAGAYAARQRARQQARRARTSDPGALTAQEAARSVLSILRRVRPWCHRARMSQQTHWALMMGFFHHGDGCHADRYSIAEARGAIRLFERIQGINTRRQRLFASLSPR